MLEIRLTDVAKHFYLSPNYLSILIKKRDRPDFQRAADPETHRPGQKDAGTDQPAHPGYHRTGRLQRLFLLYQAFQKAYGLYPIRLPKSHRASLGGASKFVSPLSALRRTRCPGKVRALHTKTGRPAHCKPGRPVPSPALLFCFFYFSVKVAHSVPLQSQAPQPLMSTWSAWHL